MVEVIRVIKGASERKFGEDNLPILPYAVYNIGNSNPKNLLDAEMLIESYNFESHKELIAMQPRNVSVTYADMIPLEKDYDFKPNTSLRDGLRKFAKWYKELAFNNNYIN